MPPDAIKSPIPTPASTSSTPSRAKNPRGTISPVPTPLRNATPSVGHIPTPPPAFAPYELDDEATLRPSTPELIKVTKVKKASGKKKKTKDKDAVTPPAGVSAGGNGDVR